MTKKERVGEEKEGKKKGKGGKKERKGRTKKIKSKDKEQRHGKMKISFLNMSSLKN